jgi:hypothetical protein
MTELLPYKKVGPKNSNPLLFLQAQGDGDHRTCRNIVARDHKRRLRAAFLAANGAHANFPVGVSA